VQDVTDLKAGVGANHLVGGGPDSIYGVKGRDTLIDSGEHDRDRISPGSNWSAAFSSRFAVRWL